MAAAYGVPLGGALFALEVLRGELALRFVLPALVTSLIATGVSWAFLPDAPTYLIPDYPGSISSAAWALLAAPVIGRRLRALCPCSRLGGSPPSNRQMAPYSPDPGTYPAGSGFYPVPSVVRQWPGRGRNWPSPAE